jgi:hypothetical protein
MPALHKFNGNGKVKGAHLKVAATESKPLPVTRQRHVSPFHQRVRTAKYYEYFTDGA